MRADVADWRGDSESLGVKCRFDYSSESRSRVESATNISPSPKKGDDNTPEVRVYNVASDGKRANITTLKTREARESTEASSAEVELAS